MTIITSPVGSPEMDADLKAAQAPCMVCRGTGSCWRPGWSTPAPCLRCRGSGRAVCRWHPTEFAGSCHFCRGTGKTSGEKKMIQHLSVRELEAVRAYQNILRRSLVDWRAYVAAVDAKDAKLAEEIDRRRGNTASELDRAKRALDDALSA